MIEILKRTTSWSDTNYLNILQFSKIENWDIRWLFSEGIKLNNKYPIVQGNFFLSKANTEKIRIENGQEYKILWVRSYGMGAFINRVVDGSTLKMRTYQKALNNALFWCKVDTKNGAFWTITWELYEWIGSSNMTFAKIDTNKVLLPYIELLFKVKAFNQYMDSFVTWTTNRKYLSQDQIFNDIKFPLPDIDTQEQIVSKYYAKIDEANRLDALVIAKEKEIESYLMETLGITIKNSEKKVGLNFVRFKDMKSWTIDDAVSENKISSLNYNTIRLNESNYVIKASRGKSPKYRENTNAFILNQKCNRWDYLDLQFAKSVDEDWYNTVNEWLKTKVWDIIINSTWEWTLWRSSLVRDWFEWLLCDSHMLLLRVDQKKLNPEFLVKQINSPFFQKQIDWIKWARATNQTELWVDNLLNLVFVIPEDIVIQNNIVKSISKLNKDIMESKEKSERLKMEAKIEFEKELFS